MKIVKIALLALITFSIAFSVHTFAAPKSKAAVGGAAQQKSVGKRKCIRNGGTFYEFSDGRKICVPAAQVSKRQKPSDVIPKMSDKKKCWRAGGVWITKPEPMGTFCLKKLAASKI